MKKNVHDGNQYINFKVRFDDYFDYSDRMKELVKLDTIRLIEKYYPENHFDAQYKIDLINFSIERYDEQEEYEYCELLKNTKEHYLSLQTPEISNIDTSN